MKRLLIFALAVAALGFGPGAAATDPCANGPRSLILSAFPGEIDRLVTTADITDVIEIDDRTFFAGTLAGNDVVMGLTGIGLVNAERTARDAIAKVPCISAAMFSGVSGGRTNIGDVTVPERWTADDITFFDVDPNMYAVAQAAAANAELTAEVPLGDVACIGVDPGLIKPITLPNQPVITFGGVGKSADPFGGRAFPCIPFGGDVFGCNPCRSPAGPQAPDVSRFVRDAIPFVDPAFFLSYFESPPPATTEYDAEDMETAAVAKVAAEKGIPFIGFRSLSDGNGDPLHLPGFPFQFFIYRQVSADNAAAMTIAFLEAWANQS